MSNNRVVLRNVFGKAVKVVYVQPCRDPKTGQFPPHVKQVDDKGNMILTDAEKNSGKIFIPVNKDFALRDGKSFDLDNPYEAAEWYAIQFCPFIAVSRDARDQNGNYLIDGGNDMKDGTPNSRRYGRAEFFIENVEQETRNAITRIELRHNAEAYVIDDTPDHRRVVAKLLGRSMDSSLDADVKQYLLDTAGKYPQKIVDAYTDPDNKLKLLLIEAIAKKIITVKGGLYIYSDNTVLGGSEDATINWMKSPENAKMLSIMKQDIYPQFAVGSTEKKPGRPKADSAEKIVEEA